MNAPAPKDLEIAFAQTFQAAMRGLEFVQQAAVNEAIEKLQKGLGSVHLHALPPMPWVSFVVNRDAVRVICWREGSALVLAWVALHADAYRWAERHTPLQFGNVIRIRKTVIEDAPAADATADGRTVAPPGPLADVRDKIFRAFAVSPGLATALRALPDDDALLELGERLDKPLAEALVSLATDPDGLDLIVARYHAARASAATAPPPTLAQAVKASMNAEQFWVAPPEQRAIEAALAGDSTTWRVFLHPAQKRLVTTKTSGPFLVTGGPGTGKTVVALHRARFLTEQFAATRARPVLVTTFSRILASLLESGLAIVCRGEEHLLERTTTLTLTGAAARVLELAREPAAVLLGDDIDAAWSEALTVDKLGLQRRFYEAERDDVVLAQEITTEERYLSAARAGRTERLDRTKRKEIWKLLTVFETALTKRGGDDPGGLARRATALLRAGTVESPFAAVVCDEVQDASRWQLRLLAALATQKGEALPGPDRLFLVGDGHQRLYEKPASLRSCGIEVRGRSARLRLNYRTTQGICAAALDALAGEELDVLEQEAHPNDTAADVERGYRSLRAGARPTSHAFATADEEADFIATAIGATKARPFLVLARTRSMLAALQDRLRARGVATTMLGDTDALPAGDHVVLATLHRSKGLEAPQVILAGMQEVPLRFPGGSNEDKTLWARKERLLVYVGMTRARDGCLLTKVRAA